jgi:hypothetical protein
MSTPSINAVVMCTARDIQAALLQIYDALLGTDDFGAIHSLTIEETNSVIEDMAFGWVRFGHFWSTPGAYVQNYVNWVRETMDPKIPNTASGTNSDIEAEQYVQAVWDAWVESLKSRDHGAYGPSGTSHVKHDHNTQLPCYTRCRAWGSN